ncbi:hypothetical protein HBI56_236400 [Parastagonospora nodorum]|uniref:Uncharacterized protein n=1 Tax=Phaeosphaeria nodorum (strain SN15 / ATCC MYA-4574 / FGSC 10173) TaxID=321614 RepID=A0A7U2F135_PHANO|nr:hypothetical protein HBH56_244180 [Parastagonospora nodorum]QRC95643.1 hypothetical protein JI435_407740 [Parastagonospora nodorum SN15]KAH3937143.1 hypothetical protein HBH54_011380 [Parastagonospora nodorum]KAH3967566.1 hypothetical protein HBH51_134840 [Parastagonospora nodorum]KAH4137107.1 hypothetical protein HBH45_129390 [Parastagonospora nodorum]
MEFGIPLVAKIVSLRETISTLFRRFDGHSLSDTMHCRKQDKTSCTLISAFGNKITTV